MTHTTRPGRPRWQLLGPVQGRLGDRVLDLGAPRQRAIAAMVLAGAGEPVSMAAIVGAVWGDRAPGHATNVVHRHVGVLRRAVDPDLPRRAQGDWLLSYSRGYRMSLDDADLDLVRFRDLAGRAGTEPDRERSAGLLEDALGLYRGRVADDVRDVLVDDAVLVALEQEVVEVAIDAGSLAASIGRAERVLPALTRVAADHPLDERVQAALMRCLAGAGRRDEALRHFRGLRRVLRDELGVDPGQALRAAHDDVLQDRLPTGAVTATSRLPVPAQLPPDLGIFVGRAAELRDLRRAVPTPAEPTVVSLVTGSAGVGKTSLAVKAAQEQADRFPDGQLYVDLRGFDPSGRPVPPSDVLARFLAALDVRPDALPPDLEDRAALWRSAAASRRMLVVLDNARDTAQVRPLLPAGTGCHVVVTSRVQLRGLVGLTHHVHPLQPFDAVGSRAFVKARLGTAGTAGDGPGDAEVAELWHRLSDGLPLSLALLTARAAQNPSLSLRAIAAAVQEAEGSLDPFVDRGDARTDPRAVLSWSFDAVGEDARRLLLLTALYPQASVPVPTAAAVAGVADHVARKLLDELAEVSLLSECEPGRFFRHDLLGRYLHERLAEVPPPEREAAEVRLVEATTRLAVHAALALDPSRLTPDEIGETERGPAPWMSTPDQALAWFSAEHEALVALTLRAGRSSGLQLWCWRLAWALDQYLDRGGFWRDDRTIQQAGAESARALGSPLAEAVSARSLARVHTHLGSFDTAADLLEAATCRLDDTVGDHRWMLSELHRSLAWIHQWREDPWSGLVHARRAVDLLGDGATRSQRIDALDHLAWCEALVGDDAAALHHADAAFDLLSDGEDMYLVGNLWGVRGVALGHVGRHTEAVAAHVRSVRIFRAFGSDVGEADALLYLGETLLRAGHPATAEGLWVHARTMLDALGHGTAVRPQRRIEELRLSVVPSG